ncbi:PREDICTED: hemagglutinin/amebocyte aggregation factor-like [Acropora digitifera]|uniref:hemagglutinin/amebocyte aggregation factor-like n=1 Tax=Acropora digitifera TaxID=70779 RepID=UPI00077A9405|nr:PREDICTED: hemagglutinin/amebocyte aggregation factor-like [Acropora digitifera]
MKGSKLALLLLLVVALEILLFKGSDADPWWRRRRRRRHKSPSCRSSRPSSPRWVNNWQKNFNIRCPNKYSIFVWQSRHRNCKGDRIYYFKCKYGPFADQGWHCSSTQYVNHYDRQLVFKCANNSVIAGVKSTYSYGAKDRRFSFRCCHIPGHIAHTCMHTAIQNKWDQPMRYEVPKDYYMVGAFSEHENSKEDRTWIFEICRFGKAC